MNLKRATKRLLAALLVLPVIAVGLVIALMIVVEQDSPLGVLLSVTVPPVIVLAFLSHLVVWVLLLVMSLDAKYGLPSEQRIPWFLVVFLGGMLGQWVFFWVKVWPDPKVPAMQYAQPVASENYPRGPHSSETASG